MASIAERLTKAATAAPGRDGRDAETPAQIPGQGWKEVAFRTWKETSKDNMSLVAAGVAFYGFLAMVPLLGATVLTYGLVASPDTVLHNVQSLAKSLPKDAADLIGSQLLNVVKTSGGKKGLGIVAALAVALWGARNAAGSIVIALNIAYEEDEKRSFIKVTLLSLLITTAGVLLGLFGVAVIGLTAGLEDLLPSVGPVGAFVGKVLGYVLLAATAAAAAATLYRYGPSRIKAQWMWITPGTILFALGWVVLSLAFGFYVSHFGKYNVTYGSLGGVIVLVTWMYLSSFLLLFGAELNSEVEHQTAKDTTAPPGDKPLGARGAWSADHVADGPGDSDRKDDSGTEQALSDDHSTSQKLPTAVEADQPSEHPYLVARITNRAAGFAGLRKIGMVSSVVSTLGLSMLRKRGRAGAGAALIATAVGLSLMRRED